MAPSPLIIDALPPASVIPTASYSKRLLAIVRKKLSPSKPAPINNLPVNFFCEQPLYKHFQSIVNSLEADEYDMLNSCLYSPNDDLQQISNSNDSDDSWDDVGGLVYAKQTLFQIMRNFMNPNPHNASPLFDAPKGILLFGPPGCGKTLLAKALAKNSRREFHKRNSSINSQNSTTVTTVTPGLTFLVVLPSTFLRKYIGETSKQVKCLFTLSRKLSPCLIFIDEIDSIFRSRVDDPGLDVNRDMKTEFMQLWDGIGESSSKNKLLIVGATNRPHDVDPAIQRRMPRSFFIGLPTKSERSEILRKLLLSEGGANANVQSNFDFNSVAKNCQGYSGSDLKEVCRCALQINSNNNPSSSSFNRGLSVSDFKIALQRIVPTQLEAVNYRNRLDQFERQMDNDPSSLFPKQQQPPPVVGKWKDDDSVCGVDGYYEDDSDDDDEEEEEDGGASGHLSEDED
jgi:SpoVK/Ycf46/Vps4 family AAA+-type ATPase